MTKYIPLDALVAEIQRRALKAGLHDGVIAETREDECYSILSFIDTLEVKEMDVWKTVDNINPPQADRNKIYCVLTKDRYILATVINHPKDEGLLQWKCTEFPNHRYDMCEGDKYMQIV